MMCEEAEAPLSEEFARVVAETRLGDSVVDSSHRVWGVPNLLVADGSVLPTQGAANPALVIMALADRLAGLLARKRLGAQEAA